MGAPLLADKRKFATRILSGSTARQMRVATSRAQFIACHPGRRAGKSWAIPRLALWACTRAPGGDVVLGAETQKKAKALFWNALLAYVKDDPAWKVNASEGWIQSPWGPTIRLWGVKDDGAVALLRGFSVVECHFDEVASYARRLTTLVDDVIEPMLGEWRHYPGCGRCFLWGTPSYTRLGPWFDICEGNTPGWEVHHWTVLENEHYPNPRQYLDGVLKRHKWKPTRPIYLREYMGRFVDDASRLVFAYSEACLIDEMPPEYDAKTWEHTLAVDFGVVHKTAWALVASNPKARTPQTYLVKVRAARGLLTEAVSNITADFVANYRVVRLVGDAHGLGKTYIDTWNQLPSDRDSKRVEGRKEPLSPLLMVAADKGDKRGWIEIINDDLTTGLFKVVKKDCVDWIDEVCSLPWDEDRLKPDPAYDDDSAHAVVYAFRHHRAAMRTDRTKPDARASDQQRINRKLDDEALRGQREAWYDK